MPIHCLMPALDRLTDELAALVGCESPSSDIEATASCARLAARIGAGWLDAPPEELRTDGRTHLRWRLGRRCRVLLLGHLDTVWPIGTLARWPFEIHGDQATGPGVFDMKAGLVQMLAAVAQLDDPDGVWVLITSDEELGSPTSRPLIAETARDADAVLVFEPATGAALKVARKGVSHYQVLITGRAAHAGLEPERGINAAIEAAHQLLAIAALGDPPAGTTVTPTVVAAGTVANAVPAAASVAVDVRARTRSEQERVDAALRRLRPRLAGAELSVNLRAQAPPLEKAASRDLFTQAREAAGALGLPPLSGAEAGGGSDGNFTAAAGIPTLDGLGAVGGNAHAEGEWTSLPAMGERSALAAGLIQRILQA